MNQTIWTNWVRSSTTSWTCGYGNEIWTIWNHATAATTAYAQYPMIVHAQDRARNGTGEILERRRISPEERARHEAAERVAVEEGYRRLEAKKEADRKAETLLRSCLTQEQIDDLDRKQCFYLYSKGKKYRIDRGQHGNVKLLDQRDQVVESYCIQPKGGLPDADAMLAQKLLLETDPESFRKISNITMRGGVVVPGIQGFR